MVGSGDIGSGDIELDIFEVLGSIPASVPASVPASIMLDNVIKEVKPNNSKSYFHVLIKR